MTRVDECRSCGDTAEGDDRLMFYSRLARFPKPPVAKEFYCHRCLRAMRHNAIIGFTLLGLVVLALTGVTVWLVTTGP